MKASDVFGRVVAFQRVFVSITESVTAGLMLSQALYWDERAESEDGWWWKTQQEWELETGMTRHEIESARKKCAKFLSFELRGVPAKGWYKINDDAIFEALGLLQASLPESGKLVCRKVENKVSENRQTTNRENTSESTSLEEKESHEAIALWIQEYNAVNKTQYFVGSDKKQKADRAGIKQLIKSGVSAEEIRSIAHSMFAYVLPPNKTFSWCKNCKTIGGFVERFNEIAGEIASTTAIVKNPISERIEREKKLKALNRRYDELVDATYYEWDAKAHPELVAEKKRVRAEIDELEKAGQ